MNRFFSVMVVGNNPDEVLSKFDYNKRVPVYVKYRFCDKEKLYNQTVNVIETLLNSEDKYGLDEVAIKTLRAKLYKLKSMEAFDYYRYITNGLQYDENGDALSSENPNGKWISCKKDYDLINPLIITPQTINNLEKKEVFTAKKGEVDWVSMSNENTELYSRTWDLCVNNIDPETEQDKSIVKNMGHLTYYFNQFKDKEEYVIHNTAFWTNVFVDKNGVWYDIDETDSKDWIRNYLSRFIYNLDDNDKLTIYTCEAPQIVDKINDIDNDMEDMIDDY